MQDAELFFQAADDTLFPIRKYSGNDFIHTSLCPNRTGSPLIISGQHDHTDSHVLQFLDRLRAVFLDDICHGNHTSQTTIFHKAQRCLAFRCQALKGCLFLCGHRRMSADIGKASACQ